MTQKQQLRTLLLLFVLAGISGFGGALLKLEHGTSIWSQILMAMSLLFSIGLLGMLLFWVFKKARA